MIVKICLIIITANGPRPRAVAVLRTEFSPLKIELLRENQASG
jgi:hypothetical protein